MKSIEEEHDIIWEGSSYVAYGIYDPKLASLVANLIEKHGPIPRESEGFISVGDGVVSVSRDLYDVDPYGGYSIFVASQTVCIELSEKQVKSDEKKALTADKIISALDGFFTSDFPDAQIRELVSKAVKENGAVCRIL